MALFYKSINPSVSPTGIPVITLHALPIYK